VRGVGAEKARYIKACRRRMQLRRRSYRLRRETSSVRWFGLTLARHRSCFTLVRELGVECELGCRSLRRRWGFLVTDARSSVEIGDRRFAA